MSREAATSAGEIVSQEPESDDYLYDDDYSAEEEEMWEAEMNCSMDSHGQCGQAGSEYCEFDCPFRH